MTARTLGLLLALGTGAAAAPPVPLGPCGPVDRPYDAIELPAVRLRRLGAPPIAHLGLLAVRDGVAGPIPFQIDERGNHKIVLPEGPEATTDDRPGVFDADDLLVFMACDAGVQATEAVRERAIAPAGVTAWREVRLEDPLAHTVAYVYLVVADHPPASDRRYVDYDAAHDLVSAARYRVGLVHALPTYFAIALGGPLGPNLLDGARLRAEATLRASLAHWALDERDGYHRLVAWKAGPVRIVRRSRHQVHLGAGIYLTAGLAHTYFYAQHVFGPGSLKLPFSPQVLFKDITAMGGADFRDLRGWRYHAPGAPPEGFAIDGHMDPAEQAFAGKGLWFLLEHDDQALLVVTSPSENLLRQVPLELVYVDDAARAAPPEEVVGSVPLVGYRGRGVQRLQGGRYTFQLRVFGLSHYRRGDEQRVLREAGAPLTANVTGQSAPAAAPAARR